MPVDYFSNLLFGSLSTALRKKSFEGRYTFASFVEERGARLVTKSYMTLNVSLRVEWHCEIRHETAAILYGGTTDESNSHGLLQTAPETGSERALDA